MIGDVLVLVKIFPRRLVGCMRRIDPGSHMERSHGREFQAVSSAPVKKLPASAGVSLPGIPVTDRGREEVDVGFGDFGPAEAISAGSQAFA